MLRHILRQIVSGALFTFITTTASYAQNSPDKLIAAARTQIGVTLYYDPTYVNLDYPGGDVPPDRGVCTDVVIRAYRTAYGYDLQKAVHEDMRANFAQYPKNWGLHSTDRNIDHRRVPNLQKFLERQKASLPVSNDPGDYAPGDLVTQMLDNRLPHIVIVSDRKHKGVPLVIHNIGRGAEEVNSLFAFPITGHYRFIPE